MKDLLEARELTIPDTPEELLALTGHPLGGEPDDPSRPSERIEALKRSAAIAEAHLTATVFAALGIKPFTPASVGRYQEAQREKAEKSVWQYGHPCLAGALFLMSISLVIGAFVTAKIMPSLFPTPIFLTGIAGIFGTAFVAVGLPTYRWEAVPFGEYVAGHRIPPEVKMLAQRLEELHPLAKLEIEYLARTADPFFVVIPPDGARHYVKVWDETYRPEV